MYVAVSEGIRSIPDHTDLEVFREWLLGCLQSFPERSIPSGTELVVDGYDVVAADEYPPESKLRAGEDDSYDVVMLTGSRAWSLASLYDLYDQFLIPIQGTPHTITRTPSFRLSSSSPGRSAPKQNTSISSSLVSALDTRSSA